MLAWRTIREAHYSMSARTVGATIDDSTLLDAVAYYPAIAMRTDRSKFGDGTFETVEMVILARHGKAECLVVLVPALITSHHRRTPMPSNHPIKGNDLSERLFQKMRDPG